MSFVIRKMEAGDRATVLGMMRSFYRSPAVFTDGSEEIYAADVDACVGDSPFLEGYVFDVGGETVGYAMLANSFSTEFGCPAVWIEDIYLVAEHRGEGIGSRFLSWVEETHPGAILRLEVEEENSRALAVYRKCGFDVLPYMEMKKIVKK